jgi:hypothetical protein
MRDERKEGIEGKKKEEKGDFRKGFLFRRNFTGGRTSNEDICEKREAE